MSQVVQADSLVTLHYRLSLQDGTEMVSTFGATPATLQLGNGELAPPLEACVTDLPVGARSVFELNAEQAFGPHKPELVQCVALSALPEGTELEPNTLLQLRPENGIPCTAFVRDVGEHAATLDFNHPLAGKMLRFEVEVIGIL